MTLISVSSFELRSSAAAARLAALSAGSAFAAGAGCGALAGFGDGASGGASDVGLLVASQVRKERIFGLGSSGLGDSTGAGILARRALAACTCV